MIKAKKVEATMIFPNADERLRATLIAFPSRKEQKAYIAGRYDALLLMQQLNPEPPYTPLCKCCTEPLGAGKTECKDCG